MDDWRALSIDSRRAALELIKAGHWRSAVSRAYYAAYCAVAHGLRTHRPELRFKHGWRNPDHMEMPRYIRNHLDHLDRASRAELSGRMRFLRKVREDADYRPSAVVDEVLARSALRVACSILLAMGVEEP
jgi:hypothetical protein